MRSIKNAVYEGFVNYCNEMCLTIIYFVNNFVSATELFIHLFLILLFYIYKTNEIFYYTLSNIIKKFNMLLFN